MPDKLLDIQLKSFEFQNVFDLPYEIGNVVESVIDVEELSNFDGMQK